jgi:dynein heavy chain, axonemal
LRLFEDLNNYQKIKPIIQKNLNLFNEEGVLKNQSRLDIVCFDYAIEHIIRINRIIRRNRGHSLLIGVGGSGKKSLTKIASFIADYEIFSISLNKKYNENSFKDDLKKLFTILGTKNKKTLFLITDSNIIDESFLEYINNLLTNGFVPALFNEEEKIPLIDSIINEIRENNIVESKETCFKYYIEKCINNLHIVLSMSPGENLRIMCRDFPGLVNNTQIDFFDNWPKEVFLNLN